MREYWCSCGPCLAKYGGPYKLSRSQFYRHNDIKPEHRELPDTEPSLHDQSSSSFRRLLLSAFAVSERVNASSVNGEV